MINERLDEFTFLSKIGEGGMATVYKAFDNNFADHVAIKVLKKELVYNKNVRARFIAEARKLHQLSHQNIIRVRRIIDAGDVVAFAMDLVAGQSLKDYVDSHKPMEKLEIKNFLNQILNALEFVHSKGFVHRDIKPSNFMVTEDKKILLLDFGIAKDVNSTNSDYTATGTNHQMGTPSYMSPEQIKSTKAVDHRSDIYSLGVVLYYMVNGYGPYEGQNLSLFELYEKIVNEELKLTGSNFDNLIKSATIKDVDWRIQNCQDFRDNIEKSDASEKLEDFSHRGAYEERKREALKEEWIREIQSDNSVKASPSKGRTSFIPKIDFWSGLGIAKYFIFGIWLMVKFGKHKDYGFTITVISTIIIFYGFYLMILPKSKD